MLHNANPERFGGIQFPRLSAGAESQSGMLTRGGRGGW